MIAALLLIAGSIQAVNDILHPRVPTNRASFVQGLVGLDWLWMPDGGANIPALAGLLAFLLLPFGLLPAHRRFWAGVMATVLFAGLAIAAAILPATPASAFAARGNACLIAAVVFAWFLITQHLPRKNRAMPRYVSWIAVLLTLTVMIGNARADLDWARYRAALHAELRRATGLIPFPPKTEVAILSRDTWPWASPLMSVWFAPQRQVRSLLLNQPGSGVQPFDPASLAPHLPLPLDAALAAAFRR
ncbi:hypothetical protein ACELLULO517_08825 [Acidisoma cellulosilytica]|uniref:Uncharacterized protein n=1 Tax=Acidisoma cellulosilyticum TaxID=2802395 RepID=A0A964E3G0_9PROT|nr:hypothetical protein [Acidisoma cellulosilyticum]MCB8880334.1 hypothetical protein [Acidisoma cellulosilyticum]